MPACTGTAQGEKILAKRNGRYFRVRAFLLCLLSFIATTSEMDKKGSVVFRVPFTLATKTVTYQDTNGQSKNIVFSLYDVSADYILGLSDNRHPERKEDQGAV